MMVSGLGAAIRTEGPGPKRPWDSMFRAFLTLLGILFIFALAGAGGVLFIFHNYGRDLPEYQQLADYEPPVMTRVYAGDGRLLAEYAVEKRVFVPIEGGERDPGGMADKLTKIGILSERIEIEPENLFGSAPEGKRGFAIIEALLDSGSDSIIVFTNTVEEARNLASISRLSEKIGVNSEHIDAGTPLSSRRSTIEAFRNGEVQVLFNYGILTTGFDAPNIDAVVILRRSIDRSSSLFSQMVGRGLRGPKFGGTEQCRIVHYRGD